MTNTHFFVVEKRMLDVRNTTIWRGRNRLTANAAFYAKAQKAFAMMRVLFAVFIGCVFELIVRINLSVATLTTKTVGVISFAESFQKRSVGKTTRGAYIGATIRPIERIIAHIDAS